MSQFAFSRRHFIQSAAAISGLAAAQTLLSIQPHPRPRLPKFVCNWVGLPQMACLASRCHEEGLLYRVGIAAGNRSRLSQCGWVAGVASGQAMLGQISSSPRSCLQEAQVCRSRRSLQAIRNIPTLTLPQG